MIYASIAEGGLGNFSQVNVRRAAAGWVAACLVFSAGFALAAGPAVRFDMAGAIPARDVTTHEFAAANPGERLIEVSLQISSLIEHRAESSLLQFLYRVETPHQSFEVFDYLPKTTLTTEYAGPIGHAKSQEKAESGGINLSGSYQDIVTGSAQASRSWKATSSVRYDLLPPLELLAASGTTHRGSGVFFKLKPSPRSSLEGAKEFVVVLRVPANWRADCIWVTCEALAEGGRNSFGMEGSPSRIVQSFVSPLYQEGDEEAKRAAQRLARNEGMLRDAAVRYAGAIRDKASGNWPLQVGVFLSVSEPKIPDGWLDRLVAAPAGADVEVYTRNLPPAVRSPADDYVSAKLALRALSGGTPVAARGWKVK